MWKTKVLNKVIISWIITTKAIELNCTDFYPIFYVCMDETIFWIGTQLNIFASLSL